MLLTVAISPLSPKQTQHRNTWKRVAAVLQDTFFPAAATAAVKESMAAAEYYDLPPVAAEDDIGIYNDERPIKTNASNPSMVLGAHCFGTCTILVLITACINFKHNNDHHLMICSIIRELPN
jgi:hypothetical protein